MAIKDMIKNFGGKGKERKEKFRELEEDYRMQKILEDRQKSSNLRELERYAKEDEEKEIKSQLGYMRKKRQKDIDFNHNSLDTPNITKETKWKVLKEPNLFSNNKNMFDNNKFIHKGNPNLLNRGKRVC